MTDQLAALRGSLARPRLDVEAQPRRTAADASVIPARQAAVLALFAPMGADGPEVVLTTRAADLRSHGGEVSFPGGAVEPSDADLTATALREAAEEVGLQPSTVDVLGQLPQAHVPVSGFDVTAIVAAWTSPHQLSIADPAEVAAVHRVGVEVLASPQVRHTAVHPSGFRTPAFVLPDSGSATREVLVWGLTAHFLDVLLRLGGWAGPWDSSREVRVCR